MPASFARRAFLKNAAVAVGGLTLASRWSSIARAAEGAGYDVGIQIYSLRGFPVEEAMIICHDLGINAVEFFDKMYPSKSTPAEIATMKEKMEGLGLRPTAHGVDKLTKDHEKNKALFEFAKAAGFKNITADPDPDSFESLDSLVKEYDIRVAIHNHGPAHRYNKVVDVLRAIEGHDERIGACADLGHYIRSGENSVDVIRALKGRLYGIHLKDFVETDEKGKWKGVILGRGHLNCEETFAAMQEVKFPEDGAISLEYEENPKDPVEEIKQCLAVARAAAEKVANS